MSTIGLAALRWAGSDSATSFDPRRDRGLFADVVAALHSVSPSRLAGGFQKHADFGEEVEQA
jgi:hypothetical protein